MSSRTVADIAWSIAVDFTVSLQLVKDLADVRARIFFLVADGGFAGSAGSRCFTQPQGNNRSNQRKVPRYRCGPSLLIPIVPDRNQHRTESYTSILGLRAW